MKQRILILPILALVLVFVMSMGATTHLSAQSPTATATPAGITGSGRITGPLDGEAKALTGAGATFPAPLYSAWFSDYATLTGVQINYQAIGSGGGIKSITDGTTDFGASDAPMTDAQVTAAVAKCGAPMLHLPMTMGGVVITYNVKELTSAGVILKLTPAELVGIFDGSISTWNDPKLVADNPGLKDVAQPIAVVHRSDGSGTTNILTTYFSAVNADWKKNVGAGTSVKWPTGIGQKGSSGVSGAVASVPYALGYVELAYAIQNNLPVTFVKNAAGNFLQPNADTVSAAAAGVALPADLRVMIVNEPGANAYPISGFTWILVCSKQADQSKAIALTRMLWWATHDGQAYAAKLGYAPLPQEAITADEGQINKILFNGKPALPAS